MPKFMGAVLGLVAGYAAGAGLGAGIVALFSGNAHDKSIEIVMTAAFVTGPLGALLGLLAAVVWAWRGGAR
jgi:hypothetical protein